MKLLRNLAVLLNPPPPIPPFHFACSMATFQRLSAQFRRETGPGVGDEPEARHRAARVEEVWAGLQIFIDDSLPLGRLEKRDGRGPAPRGA